MDLVCRRPNRCARGQTEPFLWQTPKGLRDRGRRSGETLKVLQEGEKSGAEDYKEALKDTKLSADVLALIEKKLLPAQQAHIRTLARLLDAAAA